MTLTADLFALQEIDSAVDAAEREMEQIRAAAAEDAAQLSARAALAEAEVRHAAADGRARDLETEIGDRRLKIAPVERRLYDGSVRNPKELQDLQDDVNMLRRRQGVLEDQQLAAMEELEAAAAALAAARAAMSEAESVAGATRATQRTREQELVADVARLNAQREGRVARIPSDAIAQYERLRRVKRGLAVVRVQRGACQGCRITLPTTIQQRARSGVQIVHCTSCERILYAG
ncbi:MAG: C4-type zinc ribbon domain-containing protein [Dehalococcoidia bacterium]